MKRSLRVHLLPALLEPGELAGGVAVVIDVLRATTTMIHALAAGASRVVPCGEIDEARQIAAGLPAGTTLLGGERGGLRIPGFDLGNSPAEYAPAIVAGKTIVMTTTNGTRALLRVREARRVLVAAFANLNAVVGFLVAETGPIHIVCAGTDGAVTLEDVLCAGCIVEGLQRAVSDLDLTDDSAALALNLSETRASHYDRFLAVLRAGRGGGNLIENGLEDDISVAARWDVADLVPELSREPWQIQPAADAAAMKKRFAEPPRSSSCP
jgi:2-phosphosulfolactate phosphatase